MEALSSGISQPQPQQQPQQHPQQQPQQHQPQQPIVELESCPTDLAPPGAEETMQASTDDTSPCAADVASASAGGESCAQHEGPLQHAPCETHAPTEPPPSKPPEPLPPLAGVPEDATAATPSDEPAGAAAALPGAAAAPAPAASASVDSQRSALMHAVSCTRPAGECRELGCSMMKAKLTKLHDHSLTCTVPSCNLCHIWSKLKRRRHSVARQAAARAAEPATAPSAARVPAAAAKLHPPRLNASTGVGGGSCPDAVASSAQATAQGSAASSSVSAGAGSAGLAPPAVHPDAPLPDPFSPPTGGGAQLLAVHRCVPTDAPLNDPHAAGEARIPDNPQ